MKMSEELVVFLIGLVVVLGSWALAWFLPVSPLTILFGVATILGAGAMFGCSDPDAAPVGFLLAGLFSVLGTAPFITFDEGQTHDVNTPVVVQEELWGTVEISTLEHSKTMGGWLVGKHEEKIWHTVGDVSITCGEPLTIIVGEQAVDCPADTTVSIGDAESVLIQKGTFVKPYDIGALVP